jgi:hypothetical protein
MAPAYTAGVQGICLGLPEKLGRDGNGRKDRSRGNLRQPVLRRALDSQLEFAAIAEGFTTSAKVLECSDRRQPAHLADESEARAFPELAPK